MESVNLALGSNLSRCMYIVQNERHHDGNQKGKKPGGGHTKQANRKENFNRKRYGKGLRTRTQREKDIAEHRLVRDNNTRKT